MMRVLTSTTRIRAVTDRRSQLSDLHPAPPSESRAIARGALSLIWLRISVILGCGRWEAAYLDGNVTGPDDPGWDRGPEGYR